MLTKPGLPLTQTAFEGGPEGVTATEKASSRARPRPGQVSPCHPAVTSQGRGSLARSRASQPLPRRVLFGATPLRAAGVQASVPCVVV